MNFIGRGDRGGVPSFSVERKPQAACKNTHIRKVSCKSTDTDIMNCEFGFDEADKSSDGVYVQCAKCTPDHLIEILDTIKPIKTSKNRQDMINVSWFDLIFLY